MMWQFSRKENVGRATCAMPKRKVIFKTMHFFKKKSFYFPELKQFIHSLQVIFKSQCKKTKEENPKGSTVVACMPSMPCMLEALGSSPPLHPRGMVTDTWNPAPQRYKHTDPKFKDTLAKPRTSNMRLPGLPTWDCLNICLVSPPLPAKIPNSHNSKS